MSRKRPNDSQHDASAMETARLMQSKRTNDGTKQNYKSKIKIMTKWMKQHYPGALNSREELIIPVARENVVRFFGELTLSRIKPRNLRCLTKAARIRYQMVRICSVKESNPPTFDISYDCGYQVS
jgi:hypothetical protein